jgi:Zn-dependent metalloprotease
MLALPVTSAGAAGSRQSLRAELVSRADGHGTFRGAAGTAGVFFGTDPGHPARRPAGVGANDSAAAAAASWMRVYGKAFGISDAARDLRSERVEASQGGAVVHLQQTVSGLPVVGGELSVLLDGSNNLVSVLGHVSTAATTVTTPAVDSGSAQTVAIRAVSRGRSGTFTATKPVLSVLDPEVINSPDTVGPLTVWRTTVSSGSHLVRHDVYVEATHGGIALDLDDNPRASRTVCQPNGYDGTPSSELIVDPTCDGPDTEIVSPTNNFNGDADAIDAYRFAHAVDDFYLSLLNRNSLDGKGMPLNSTIHFCDATDPNPVCPLPNAFWDGREMVYGDGYAQGLDVVGHEMTHGVTEHTSNLLSYYQSGAINESQSDVMGELIQQIEGPGLNASGQTDVYDPARPWQIGEELTDPAAPFRHMDHPENDTTLDSRGHVVAAPDPDNMTSSHYNASPFYLDNGGVHENAGVGNKAAFLIARGADTLDQTFNGYKITGVAGDGSSSDPNNTGETEDLIVKDVKTANIYYQLDKMMVSATTYADLYKLLPQACNALVAANKPLPMPAAWPTATAPKITSSDCFQVSQAVKATKMNVQPTKAGAAVAPASPYCTNGGSPTSRHTDSFETNPYSAGTYTRSHTTYTVPDPYGDSFRSGEYGSWGWTKDYQLRGSSASLWGNDADPFLASPDKNRPAYAYEDARAQKVSAVRGAIGTYVRFRTAWNFDASPAFAGDTIHNFDGGVVEYSIDGGNTWHDAGSLFVNNGYNGRINNTDGLWTSSYVDPNPLKRRMGFVRDSHGWTASRLNLSSLKGKRVLLRWRIGADDGVGGFGWFVDDVQSYSCNPTHIGISAPSTVHKGQTATVSGHVVRAGTLTALANLPVRLWEKRHGTTGWVLVGTHITNRYGNVHWRRTHSAAYDYRVRMPGKKPFAPSNYATKTVRIG